MPGCCSAGPAGSRHWRRIREWFGFCPVFYRKFPHSAISFLIRDAEQPLLTVAELPLRLKEPEPCSERRTVKGNTKNPAGDKTAGNSGNGLEIPELHPFAFANERDQEGI